MEPIIKKLALFSLSPHMIVCVREEHAERDPDFSRISGYVEIQFPPLPQDEVLNNQIKSIDKQIETVQQETIDLVNKLKQKKQELLALEHTA